MYSNMKERLTPHHKADEVLPPGSHIVIFCDATAGKSKKETKRTVANGVNTTMMNITQKLEDFGYKPHVISPTMFRSVPLPIDKEFRVPLVRPKKLRSLMQSIKPDAIVNMSPEGALGLSAVRACNTFPLSYTASYTTNLDEYFAEYAAAALHGKISVSPELLHPALRKLYKKAERVLVPTERIQRKLEKIGIERAVVWPGGVDSELFRPIRATESNAYARYGWESLPILLSYGRIVREKRYDDFLSLRTPGFHKVIIGDGPYKKELEEKYADDQTHFLGKLHGEELAHHVRSARLMVFSSKSDTWGLVTTEASASGVPVVAYDVQGPGDNISQGINGILVPTGKSLLEGIPEAIKIDQQKCAEYTAQKYSWDNSAKILLENLRPIQW